MDTEIDPLALVQIATEIEYRRIRLYRHISRRCVDTATAGLCRGLMAWSRQQVGRLTGMGARLRAAMPPGGASYRGNSITSDARIMAALAFFVAETSAPRLPTAVTHEWMLGDAVNRSRQAIVFYEGLKGFAHDHFAREVMDEIMQQENGHLHSMLSQLKLYRQTRRRTGPYLACIY
jgi:hypothetical protein